MTNRIVRLVKTEPMRLAVFHGYSKTPESDAHETCQAWAEAKGLLKDPATYLLFGHNNPDPSPDKEEYGYDTLITLPPDMNVDPDIQIQEFPRRLYAVVRTTLANLGQTWVYLCDWAENSGYKIADDGLEEPLLGDESDPDKFLFDLWLPIAK
ncbi:MAG: AraC family transcriptional regulator [Candidatus Hodarchaeales archaeon]